MYGAVSGALWQIIDLITLFTCASKFTQICLCVTAVLTLNRMEHDKITCTKTQYEESINPAVLCDREQNHLFCLNLNT